MTIKELERDYVEGTSAAKRYAGMKTHQTIMNWEKTKHLNSIQLGDRKWFSKKELEYCKNRTRKDI